jgi:hypothetical protein
MDLAAEYGARLTIESEKPFARANVKWNLNIMAEVRDRGFGVGTHCDIGFNDPPLTVEQFAAEFQENKSLQSLQEQGTLTWATQRQVYEAYGDWKLRG